MAESPTSPEAAQVEGVVLCAVGDTGVAVLAREVAAVEAPDGVAPWAGRDFALRGAPPEEARLLRGGSAAVVVDRLEVHAEPLPLLAVPPALGAAGRALVGFVEAAGRLWPVVSLAAMARRLEAAP